MTNFKDQGLPIRSMIMTFLHTILYRSLFTYNTIEIFNEIFFNEQLLDKHLLTKTILHKSI